ncbi:cupin-like domain-containing protein [Blastopirellula sp. JC732]|uniref:Cupin-like domain-containing protein n=1 Tax=Blastopirellula sediminis TaxID=2894196 RepID=A0A9X1MQT4_9BACT|nr:cupin-like domain-containing protein [Blastopirellula sediminis]MCC9605042.1 cupin-like domain-containing protein [Blastopirellula sediminis]MCC9631658.1 cupin-like domain-containing protein [Blastopirellula sediminis]
MSYGNLIDWNKNLHQMETEVVTTTHRLVETGLFDDEHLVRILDTHPRDALNVNTMGTDETDRRDWKEGDASKLNGEQLLQATKEGRLWLNIRNMLTHHREYADLINSIYDELETKVTGFHALERSANLLVSSPTAIVYYHLDIPINMLWHLRGKKRAYVYPPNDERFVTQSTIEDVICGESYEELHFDPKFDESAFVAELEPGQMVTWPQNTPHRVTNVEGLNVSLTTEHKTPKAIRRIKLFRANRFFRHQCGYQNLSTTTEGVGYGMKMAAFTFVKAYRKLFKKQSGNYAYPVTFELDPMNPTKVREMSAK